MPEFLDTAETRTDATGRFTLPAKFVVAPRLPPAHFGDRPYLYLLASGYEPVDLTAADQTYSRVDQKLIPIDDRISRIEARPLLTIVSDERGEMYEFRVSRLTSHDAGAEILGNHLVLAPAGKWPNYRQAFDAERAKYGLPGCYVLERPSVQEILLGEAFKAITLVSWLHEIYTRAPAQGCPSAPRSVPD